MPRYYFNVHDDTEYPDFQGTELPDLHAARAEAVRYSGSLLNEQADKFWDAKEWSMDVCDDAGLVLFTLRFSAAEMPSVRDLPHKPSIR